MCITIIPFWLHHCWNTTFGQLRAVFFLMWVRSQYTCMSDLLKVCYKWSSLDAPIHPVWDWNATYCKCFEQSRELQVIPNVRKRTFWNMHPKKTQSACASSAVWLESSLPAWRNFASLAIQNAPTEDSDQTGSMPTLIRIFAGHTCPKVRFLALWLKCNWLDASFMLFVDQSGNFAFYGSKPSVKLKCQTLSLI